MDNRRDFLKKFGLTAAALGAVVGVGGVVAPVVATPVAEPKVVAAASAALKKAKVKLDPGLKKAAEPGSEFMRYHQAWHEEMTKKLVDNVFRSSPFFNYLNGKSSISRHQPIRFPLVEPITVPWAVDDFSRTAGNSINTYTTTGTHVTSGGDSFEWDAQNGVLNVCPQTDEIS